MLNRLDQRVLQKPKLPALQNALGTRPGLHESDVGRTSTGNDKNRLLRAGRGATNFGCGWPGRGTWAQELPVPRLPCKNYPVAEDDSRGREDRSAEPIGVQGLARFRKGTCDNCRVVNDTQL